MTFPSVLLHKEGKWALRIASGAWVPFRVGPAPTPTFAAPRVSAVPFLTATALALDGFGRAPVEVRYEPALVAVAGVANGNVPGSAPTWTDAGAPHAEHRHDAGGLGRRLGVV